jgi:hypothetical protein
MRNFISVIFLGATIFLFSGCKKEVSADEIIDPKAVHSNSIVSKWELRKVTGGFRGVYPGKDFLPGNGNIWIFSDYTYQTYQNNIALYSEKYSLGRDFSNATGQITDFLMLPAYGKIYFEVKKDTLTLYRGELAYDGTIERYERNN